MQIERFELASEQAPLFGVCVCPVARYVIVQERKTFQTPCQLVTHSFMAYKDTHVEIGESAHDHRLLFHRLLCLYPALNYRSTLPWPIKTITKFSNLTGYGQARFEH